MTDSSCCAIILYSAFKPQCKRLELGVFLVLVLACTNARMRSGPEASAATAHHDALCQHSLLGVASLRDAGTGAVVWAAYINRSTTSAGCSRRLDVVLDCNASVALYDLRIS